MKKTIRRATTPTFELVFPEAITNYTAIMISFGQGKTEVLHKDETSLVLASVQPYTDKVMYTLTLTQAETNKFAEGIFDMEVRIKKGLFVNTAKVFRGRMEDVINDTVL